MRPPSIRDANAFRAHGEAVERLCAPGALDADQLDRLAETRGASVGNRVRGVHMPGEHLVIVSEGASVGVWLHEYAHAVLGAGGDAEGEAAACALASRLGGFGPGTDVSVVTPNRPADSWRFFREGGHVHVHHECGRTAETWHPTMPGREAHVLALCERCDAKGLVPLTGECCGEAVALVWTADASPSRPTVTGTCAKCGVTEALEVTRPRFEPPDPAQVYRTRARNALTQTAERLLRVASGELDPAMLGVALGDAWLAAARIEGRAAVEDVLREARVRIDGDRLHTAAEILEGAANTLD